MSVGERVWERVSVGERESVSVGERVKECGRERVGMGESE